MPSRAERPVWGLRTTCGPGRHQTDIQLCGCSWREGTHSNVRKNKLKPNSLALVEKWALSRLGLGLLLWVNKELLPPPLPNFVRNFFTDSLCGTGEVEFWVCTSSLSITERGRTERNEVFHVLIYSIWWFTSLSSARGYSVLKETWAARVGGRSLWGGCSVHEVPLVSYSTSPDCN